jgi:hypothetical protein
MRSILLLAALLVACVDHQPAITGTQSLKIELTSPASGGSIDQRLPDTARAVSFTISAIDANDQPDATFNNTLQVYVHYLGTLSPDLNSPANMLTVSMAGGKGTFSTTLDKTYGPTTVWFGDDLDPNATYATGISPTLWYRDPFISDIQTPTSETTIDAFSAAPLDTKNVAVSTSRYGASGRLVVTSVFSQGYTLADVNCANAAGAPPCTSQDYDYIEVFSYSAPLDQDRRFISEGQVVDGFAGGVTEFDGLTEIGFPQTFVVGDPVVDKGREPAIAVFDATWFTTNKIAFERNEANAVEVDGGKVCPLDSDYTTFKQWKLDPAGVADAATCAGKNVFNVISTPVPQIDPATLVGKTVPKVIGMLRPINIGSFNVWIIYPRSMADLTVN